MAFIRNTDKFIEGSKLFFSNERAKAAVQSDLDQLSSEDSAIKLRLDVIEGSGAGSISKAQADAQAYADQKVAALVNSAPEVLDTLKELSDAIGGDASFAATIAGQIGAVDAKVDQEILDRQAADSALSLRLDVLEADPVTKTYVDSQISAEQLARNSAIAVEEAARIAADNAEAVARQAEDAKKVNKAGDTMTGELILEAGLRTLNPITGFNSGGVQTITIAPEDAAFGVRRDNFETFITPNYVYVAKIDSESSEYFKSSSFIQDGQIYLYDDNLNPSLPADPAQVTTKSYVDGLVNSSVSQESSQRQTADSELSARIDALESAPGPDVDKAYVDGQVSGLQSQIDTEKGRVDAILSAADADKDSFAEIVQLINSVDTSNDSAFASYVLSNDAALAQEVSDRQAGDSTLNGKIGSLSALNISTGGGSELNLPFNTKLTVFHPSDVAVFVSHSSQEASTLMAIQSGTNVSFTVEYNGQTAVVGPYETVNAPYFNNFHLGQLVNISVLGGTVYEDIRQALSLAVAPYNLFDVNVTKVTIGASIESFASVVEAISYERLQRNGIASQLSQEVSDRQSAISGLESQVLQLGSDIYYTKLFENVETVSSSMEIDPNSGTQVFFCDVSGSSVTMTLPDPSSFAPGRKYVVKDMGSSSPSGNFITVAAQTGQTVDGQSSFEMKMPFEAAQFVSDGSQWFVM